MEGKVAHTRAFGHFEHMPHVNALPHISSVELCDADEFLIIASGTFWNVLSAQTAVDVARLKADDALEAALVLRDFAIAHSNDACFVVDEDTERPEDKLRILKRRKDTNNQTDELRYRKSNPFGVIVVNVRDYLGSK